MPRHQSARSGVAYRAWLLAMTALTTCVPLVAGAQTASAPANSVASAGIQEIIVTAQKRDQSINDVGITIQAATADTLAERGIHDIGDLAKLVPGFSASQSTFDTPVYTLRGIGLYDGTIGAPPAVAVYADQFSRNFPALSQGLDLDIQRVEVLKGPQGTLFGQSSTGGAVNYILNKPTETFEAATDLTYLRFDELQAEAFASGPITGNLLGRIAVRADEGGAWQTSVTRPSDTLGATRKVTGRLSLDWKPTDKWRLQFSATDGTDRSDPQASQYYGSLFDIYSSSALAAANANPATRNPYGVVNNGLYNAFTTPGSPGYNSAFLANQAAAVARLYSPIWTAGANQILGGKVLTSNDQAADWPVGFLTPKDNSYWQTTLRNDYSLPHDITLTSLTAFAQYRDRHNVDLNGNTDEQDEGVESWGGLSVFNQELRVSGDTDRLHWMVGGNFDHSDVADNNLYLLGDYLGNQPTPLPPLTFTENLFKTQLTTYAAFANAEYKVLDQLSVTGGVRYNNNHQTASYCYNDPASDPSQATSNLFEVLEGAFTGRSNVPSIGAGQCFPLGYGANFGIAGLTPLHETLNETNVPWHVGVDYHLDNGALLYIAVSQGWKTGVFSNIGASSLSQYNPAKQEELRDYEGGIKTPLLNHKVQLSLSGFYYDYTNKQLRAKINDPVWGLLEKLVNIPKSEVYGGEVELSVRPMAGLTVSASATALKSDVTSDFSQVDGQTVYNNLGFTGNFKGSPLPYTPPFSGNLDAQYDWSLTSDLNAFFGGTVLHEGGTNATFTNSVLDGSLLAIPAYTTLDLRAGVGSDSGKWQVTLFGRNVTNEYIIVSPTFYADSLKRVTGKPAIYGLNLKYKF